MSQVIDERVVELRFDNKQFEDGVRESMSTLDKLKAILDKGINADTFKNIENSVKGVNFSNIEQGVDAVRERFSALGIVGMRVIENITDGLYSKVTGALGAVTNQIVQGGYRRAQNIENAHFQLQGILGDEKEVQAVMADAMDSVDGTAYAYDEAAKAASMFAATGLKSGEQMQSALKAIAGVAATTNSDYASLAQIFTTVAGQGKVMSQQLNQLATRGLNAAASLGKYLGKSEADVREMVHDGEISFEIFSKAMAETFGDHAKDANQTFTGSLENIKSALSRTGAQFFQPLIEQNGELVQMFNAIRVKVNEFNKAIAPVAEKFTTMVKNAAHTVTAVIKGVKSDEAAFISDKSWDEGATQRWGKYEEVLKQTAREHGIAIDEMIEKEGSFGASLKNHWLTADIIKDAVQHLKDGTAELSQATDKGTSSLEQFREVALAVWHGDYKNGQERVEALTAAGYDYATVQKLVNLGMEKLKDGTVELNEEELKSLGITEDEIAELEKLSDSLIGTVEQQEALNKAREAFGDEDITKVWDDFNKKCEEANVSIEGVINGFDDLADSEGKVGGYTKDQWEAFGNLETAAKNAGLSIKDLVWEMDHMTMSNFGLWLETIINTGKGLWKIIQTFGQALKEVFQLTDNAKTTFRTFSEWVNKVSEAFANLSDDALEKVKNAFKFLIRGGIVLGVIKLFGKLKSMLPFLIGGFGGLGGIILKVFGAGVIGTLLHFLSETGALTPAIEGLGKAFSWVGDKLKGFYNIVSEKVQGIVDYFKKFKSDPPEWFEKLSDAMGRIRDKLGELKAKFDEVLGPYIDVIKEKISGLASQFGEFITDKTLHLIDLLIQGLEKIAEKLEAIDTEEFGKNLDNSIEKFKGFVDSVKDGSAITNFFDNVKNFFNGNKGISDGMEAVSGEVDNLVRMSSGNTTWQQAQIGQTEEVQSTFQKFADWIKTQFQPLTENVSIGSLLGVGLGATGIFATFKVIKDIESFGENVKGFLDGIKGIAQNASGILGGIAGGLKELGGVMKAEKRNLNATAFLKIAAGIALLGGVLIAMANLVNDPRKYMIPAFALSGIALSLGIAFVAMEKALGAGKPIPSMLDSLGDGLKTGIKNLTKAVTNLSIAHVISTFAASMVAIAASIAGIALLHHFLGSDVDYALLVVGGIAAVIAGIYKFIISTPVNAVGSARMDQFKSMGRVILAFAASLFIVVMALKSIMKMKLPDDAGVKIALLIGVLFGTLGLMYAMQKINEKFGGNENKLSAGPILAASLSLLLVMLALKGVMRMKIPNDWPAKLGLFGAMFGAMAGLFVIMGVTQKIAGENKLSGTGPILAACAFLITCVGALAIIGLLPVKNIAKGLFGIIGVFAALSLVMLAASKVAEGNVSWKTILAMTGFMLGTIVALSVLSLMDWPGILKGVVGLGAIMVALSLCLKSIGKINNGNSWKPVLAMAIVIGGIAASLAVLAQQNWLKLAIAAASMSACLLAYAKAFDMVLSRSYTDNQVKKVKYFLLMTVATIPIALAIGLLAFQPWNSLLVAAAGIGGCILAYAKAFNIISDSGSNIDMKTMGSFLLGSLATIAIGAALLIASQSPWQQILAAGAAISGVMLAYAAAYKVISSSASNIDMKSIGMFVLGAIGCAVIGYALSVAAEHPWQSLLAAGASIAGCLLAIAAAAAIMTKASTNVASALTAMAMFAEFMAGVAGIGMVIGDLAKYEWQSLLSSATSIAIVLLAMSVCAAILSAVGAVFPAALLGILALDAFIADLVGVMYALENLCDMEVLKGGGEKLIKLGEILGGFFGSIAGAFMETAIEKTADSFPYVGEKLSEFATNAQPFFDALNNINPDIADSAKAVAACILAITGAEILDGISNFIKGPFGGNDTNFAEKLKQFGEALCSFDDSTKGISDPTRLTKLASSIKDLMIALKEAPNTGGLVSFFTGDNDIGEFGPKLSAFGSDLSEFYRATSGIVDIQRITDMANAMQQLFTALGKIPNEGTSIAKAFVGDNTLDVFGPKLSAFGEDLSDFYDSTTGIVNTQRIADMANAMLQLFEALGKIPNEGTSIAKAFVGDNTLDVFGPKLATFGGNLASFYSATEDITNTAQIINVANAMKELFIALGDIPNEGASVAAFFVGDNSISNFGPELVKFGVYFKKFSENVTTVSSADITNAVSSIREVISICSELRNAGGAMLGTMIANFSKNLNDIAIDGITQFCSAFEGAGEQVQNAISTMLGNATNINTDNDMFYQLGLEAPKKMADGITAGANEVSTAVTGIGTKIETALNLLLPKVRISGLMVPTRYSAGIDTNRSYATTSGTSLGDAALQPLQAQSLIDAFVACGKACGQGFINGINAMEGEAVNAGSSLGQKAYEAAKAAVDSNSPSKKFEWLGTMCGLGLVIALRNAQGSVERAGEDLAYVSMSPIEESVNSIYDAFNQEMDLNPTITPTVDLKNIQSASLAATKLFNNAVDVTSSMAASTSSAIRATTTAKQVDTKNQNGDDSTGTNVTFNQYNTSPKALSAIEIYRQTNNQLKAMKGALA